MELAGPCPNHSCRFLTISVVYDRHALLDDSCLFPCYGLHRVTQILRMIQTDGGNNGHERAGHGIGCIQAASQTCLHYKILHAGLFKKHHPYEKQDFKISGMGTALLLNSLHTAHDSPKSLKKPLIFHLYFINHKALIYIHQMGRNKQPRVLSRRVKHRGQEGADRALPVCTCHVQNFHMLLRIPQVTQNRLCIFQCVLFCKFRRLLNICGRFLIGHAIVCHSCFHPFSTELSQNKTAPLFATQKVQQGVPSPAPSSGCISSAFPFPRQSCSEARG